jgi:pSer/pThr/pTyr-binding forkhead associated (FHA) protein
MPSKHDLAIQPVLVPVHGGMDKKPRPLDRDVITVGRARGCDIGLDAPDISTLHCVIYRSRDGLRLRDCGSRTGTRLNGIPAKNNSLCDGDVLQIGPFSFVVQIPAGHSVERKMPEWHKIMHWDRSRRNLVRLATNLRKRLHVALAHPSGALENELSCQADDLRSKIRTYDQRGTQLEEAERDLDQDREKLERDKEEHQVRVQKLETELSQRLKEADKEIHQRWQEFQKRCREEESQHGVQAKTAHEASNVAVAVEPIDEEEQKRLEVRKLELEKWAVALRQERLRIDQGKEQCQQAFEEVHHERQETMKMKEQFAVEQAGTEELLGKQRAALAQAEASLREQRAELGRMMADLRELQEAIRGQQGHEGAGADVGLKAENELLKQLLQEKEEVIAAVLAKAASEPVPQPAPPQTAQPQAAAPPGNLDLEHYETELNQYRQQLDTDRAKLNAEIDQLRARNHELDEATREMEMEMSRERAELGRERTRLDRLRDEVRSELERVQRDSSVRESLAPVQKLREEMTQKNKSAGNFSDRLKSFRNRISDPA